MARLSRYFGCTFSVDLICLKAMGLFIWVPVIINLIFSELILARDDVQAVIWLQIIYTNVFKDEATIKFSHISFFSMVTNFSKNPIIISLLVVIICNNYLRLLDGSKKKSL